MMKTEELQQARFGRGPSPIDFATAEGPCDHPRDGAAMREPLEDLALVTVIDPQTDRRLDAWVREVGDDVVVAIGGGERPHVGCVVLAVPSSKPGGTEHSPSVSVLTIPPHKEESIARPVAENLCRRLGRVTVVTAGVHEDGIDRAGIEVFLRLAGDLAEAIFGRLIQKA